MSIALGSFCHKGHTVRFTLSGTGVIINEKFGAIEGTEKEMDMTEASEYQQQLMEIGYGKEN